MPDQRFTPLLTCAPILSCRNPKILCHPCPVTTAAWGRSASLWLAFRSGIKRKWNELRIDIHVEMVIKKNIITWEYYFLFDSLIFKNLSLYLIKSKLKNHNKLSEFRRKQYFVLSSIVLHFLRLICIYMFIMICSYCGDSHKIWSITYVFIWN